MESSPDPAASTNTASQSAASNDPTPSGPIPTNSSVRTLRVIRKEGSTVLSISGMMLVDFDGMAVYPSAIRTRPDPLIDTNLTSKETFLAMHQRPRMRLEEIESESFAQCSTAVGDFVAFDYPGDVIPGGVLLRNRVSAQSSSVTQDLLGCAVELLEANGAIVWSVLFRVLQRSSTLGLISAAMTPATTISPQILSWGLAPTKGPDTPIQNPMAWSPVSSEDIFDFPNSPVRALRVIRKTGNTALHFAGMMLIDSNGVVAYPRAIVTRPDPLMHSNVMSKETFLAMHQNPRMRLETLESVGSAQCGTQLGDFVMFDYGVDILPGGVKVLNQVAAQPWPRVTTKRKWVHARRQRSLRHCGGAPSKCWTSTVWSGGPLH